jgi:DNA-binding transcriptional ArsR family regulator
MLSVCFDNPDFARVSFSPFPAPLVELKVSLMMSRRRDSEVMFGRWRRRLRRSLPPTTAPLWDLLSPFAGPAFIDPVSRTLDEGLSAVRRAPPELVSEGVRQIYRLRPDPVPRWLGELIDGDEDSWLLLSRALRDAFTGALERPWSAIADMHRAEFARYALLAAESGVGAALTALIPGSELRSGTWRLPAPYRRQVRVDGRGLVLLPTFHWTAVPLCLDQPGQPVLVVYPAGPGAPVIEDGTDALPAVLGQTRARVLRLLAVEHTTTEVARLAGISMGSASGHTSALRHAGLISTARDGAAVLHRRTALGTLLTGSS